MKIHQYKSIIFDLDGTLIDSWPAICEAFVRAFCHYFPNGDFSHIIQLRNNHINYLETFKLVFKTENVKEEMIHFVEKIYSDIVITQTKLFPGVTSTIALIEEKNIPWGIVTTKRKKFVDILLPHLACLSKTQALICYEDVINKKPDPEGLIKACEILKTDPKNSIYIGDSISDIHAAKSCLMHSACATYGYIADIDSAKSWGADFYFDEISNLRSLI